MGRAGEGGLVGMGAGRRAVSAIGSGVRWLDNYLIKYSVPNLHGWRSRLDRLQKQLNASDAGELQNGDIHGAMVLSCAAHNFNNTKFPGACDVFLLSSRNSFNKNLLSPRNNGFIIFFFFSIALIRFSIALIFFRLHAMKIMWRYF